MGDSAELAVARGSLNLDDHFEPHTPPRRRMTRHGRAAHVGFSGRKRSPTLSGSALNICHPAPRLGLCRMIRSKGEIISHLAGRATCAVAAGQPGARRTRLSLFHIDTGIAVSMPAATASRRRSSPCSPTTISPTGILPGWWIGRVMAQRSRKLMTDVLRRISALSRK